MKHVFILIALTTYGCDRRAEQNAAAPSPVAAKPEIATVAPSSKPAAVIPKPEDQAELDRMILAGYTPHGSHLHPPGVKECPLSQDNEAVM